MLDSEGLEGSGRKYWAVEEPEELIEHLEDRVKKYFKQLRNGVFWRRVLRNLAYYHGMTVADIARRLAISPRRVLRVLATGLEAVRAAAPSTVVFPEPVGDTAAERGRTPQG